LAPIGVAKGGGRGCMSPVIAGNFFKVYYVCCVEFLCILFSRIFSMCLRLPGALPLESAKSPRPSLLFPRSKFLATPLLEPFDQVRLHERRISQVSKYTYSNDGVALIDWNAETERSSQVRYGVRPQRNHAVPPRYSKQRRVVKELITKPPSLRCPHVNVQSCPVRVSVQ